MIKRVVVYAVVLMVTILVAVWFAFGPGLAKPLLVLFWPAESILYHLNPDAGSNPAFGVLGLALAAYAIWFAVAVVLDLGVTTLSRKLRNGG
jgi:hypothetical protein